MSEWQITLTPRERAHLAVLTLRHRPRKAAGVREMKRFRAALGLGPIVAVHLESGSLKRPVGVSPAQAASTTPATFTVTRENVRAFEMLLDSSEDGIPADTAVVLERLMGLFDDLLAGRGDRDELLTAETPDFDPGKESWTPTTEEIEAALPPAVERGDMEVAAALDALEAAATTVRRLLRQQ